MRIPNFKCSKIIYLSFSLCYFIFSNSVHSQQTDCSDPSVCSTLSITCGEIIHNPSFEMYADAVGNCEGNMENGCCWFNLSGHSGDADLFNHAFPNAFCAPDNWDFSPPIATRLNEDVSGSSPFGVTQHGYGGFYAAIEETLNPIYREYFYQTLASPIYPGESVTIKFQVTLSDFSNCATKFHVSFVNDVSTLTWFTGSGNDDNVNNIPATNRVTVPYQNFPDSWNSVNLTWTNNTAQPVNYIVIGNVDDNGGTFAAGQFVNVPPDVPPGIGTIHTCYYGIDDISVVKNTNQCCTANQIVNPLNPALPININDPSIAGYFSTGSTVFVDRPLVINVSTSFNNVTVNFGPNGYIIVNGGIAFSMFNNSLLRGCTFMWKGVDATAPGALVHFQSSRIEDAVYGIESKGGNYVNCYNMNFVNNYVGIYLRDHGNPWTNFSLRRTTFDTYPSLLPHPNFIFFTNVNKGEAGVLLENAHEVLIKPGGVLNANTFRRMSYGIKTVNTSCEVSNAHFELIRNYDSNLSFSLFADNTGATLPYLRVNNSTGVTDFNQCENGVYTQSWWLTDIHNCSFTNIRDAGFSNPVAGYAIYSVQNTPHPLAGNPQMQYYNNTFQRAKYGITQLNCGLSLTQITNNTITMWPAGGYLPQAIGIQIINKGSDPNAKCDGGPICTIANNTITRYEDGIRTSFAPCLFIDDNTIDMVPPATNQHRGIFLESSRDAIVGANTVTGNAKDWRNIGIRFFKSEGVEAYCNTVTNTGYAFWFDQDCNFSSIHHNYLNTYDNGMFFVNNAILGPQNVFGTSFNPAKNSWQKQTPGPTGDHEFTVDWTYGVFQLDGVSEFYFYNTDLNPNTNINNLDVLKIGPVFPVLTPFVSTTSNNGTNPVVYCAPYLFSPDGVVGRILNRFQQGDLPFTPFGAGNEFNNRWMYNQHVLYTSNGYDDTLSTVSIPTVMEDFIDSLELTDVGQMMEVDKQIQNGNFSTALGLNNGISGPSGSVILLQQLHNILIPQWDSIANRSPLSITVTQIDELIAIAELCPGEYGDAVIKARVFLQFHISDTLRFMNECELPVEVRQTPRIYVTNSEDVANKIVIYPNPANDHYVINTYTGLELEITIMTIQGQIQQQLTVADGSTISTSGLSSGVYVVLVKDKEGNSYPGLQLVITK